MASLYCFKNFNNYYNRRLRGQSITTISDFISTYGDYSHIETGTYYNFNPNDNVDTKIVLGCGDANAYNGDCDYVVYCEDNSNITSRWFIIEQPRNLKGQYTLTLHRDVLTDNYTQIMNADCFIEKATLPDTNNLIFNSEGVSVNQIKTTETPLKDESGCAWIVGYLASNYTGGSISIDANVIADYQFTTKAAFESDKGVTPNTEYKKRSSNDTFSFAVVWGRTTYQGKRFRYKLSLTQNGTWSWMYLDDVASTFANDYLYYSSSIDNLVTALNNDTNLKNAIWNGRSTIYSDYATYDNTKYQQVLDLNGQVLECTSGSDTGYYTLNTIVSNYTTKFYSANDTAVQTALDTFMAAQSGYISTRTPASDNTYGFTTHYNPAEFAYSGLAHGTFTATMPATADRLHLKDAPWDMFVIPYGNVTVLNTQVSGWTGINYTKSVALSIAQGLAKTIGKDFIYDLQLLPYCPLSGVRFVHTDDYTTMDINNSNTNRYTVINNSSNDPKCVLIWSAASSGTKNVSTFVAIGNKKLQNETDMWRLVSPNYNGQFEFNAAKNNGVANFNVDYTYLPYNPYIHVNPAFGALYGQDFNDNRGLVCQGDFSIAYLSDAWTTYQVNNKNYQNIFDRQIQNMETQNKYQNISSIVGSIAGAGTTGASLGALTSSAGLGLGAGVTSLIGGGIDYFTQKKLQQEAISYATDTFNYQLDNIKAMPYSIAKTTAYNENNKIFPILEYYTCSDEEKIGVANKIAYNGMTVGIIDKFSNYVNNSWTYYITNDNTITDKGYIKGKLIRIDGINEDSHYINAIAEELNKGVYLK